MYKILRYTDRALISSSAKAGGLHSVYGLRLLIDCNAATFRGFLLSYVAVVPTSRTRRRAAQW
jgi:hypothetical protein